jgi:hypothetical protein
VRDVNDAHNQIAESDQVILSLLGFLLQSNSHDHFQWDDQYIKMDQASEHFEPVEFKSLL